MTKENWEETLVRLSWVVSVTALVVFGSLSAYYYKKSNSAHGAVLTYLDMQRDASAACTKDVARCPWVKTIERWIVDSEQRRNEAHRRGSPFFVLTLAAPLTVWLLFFSSRWILTGRKPWHRQRVPQN